MTLRYGCSAVEPGLSEPQEEENMANDNPTLAEVRDTLAAFVGGTIPRKMDDLLDTADSAVEGLLGRFERTPTEPRRAAKPASSPDSTTVSSEIGPVAVTLVGKLRVGDTLYLFERWVKVSALHTSIEPDHRAVVYDILGDYDGHLEDRLVSLRNTTLVIIRPRTASRSR